MGMRFEWDDAKALLNEQKHSISFDEAVTVFADPLSLTIIDETHSDEEDRYVDIGESSSGRLLIVVYTEREETIRIIRANPRKVEQAGCDSHRA